MVLVLLIGFCGGDALAEASESGDRNGADERGEVSKLLESTGAFAFAQGFVELFGGTPSPIKQTVYKKTKVVTKEKPIIPPGVGKIVMILIGLLLIWLAIAKGFEPLLLLPIGFGGILANIPIENIAGPDGFLGIIFSMGVANGCGDETKERPTNVEHAGKIESFHFFIGYRTKMVPLSPAFCRFLAPEVAAQEQRNGS